MRIPRLTIAACVMVLSNGAAAVPQKVQSIVEVDGKKYRVLVKNGTDVYVYQKALRLDLSPSEMDRRRRAVPIATGCHIRDALTHGNDLRGILDCTIADTSPAASPNP